MRQGEINKGFDVLRERIPHPVLSKGRCEKLRKIDILHVAISYIRALENILESGEAGINEFANSLYSVVSSNCALVTAAAESSGNQSIISRKPELEAKKATGELANSRYSTVSSASPLATSTPAASPPARDDVAGSLSPSSTSESSFASSDTPSPLSSSSASFCKVEAGGSPPAAGSARRLLEKRRQNVVFQNRSHSSSG
jgi:hypothetical protein